MFIQVLVECCYMFFAETFAKSHRKKLSQTELSPTDFHALDCDFEHLLFPESRVNISTLRASSLLRMKKISFQVYIFQEFGVFL